MSKTLKQRICLNTEDDCFVQCLTANYLHSHNQEPRLLQKNFLSQIILSQLNNTGSINFGNRITN
ncbi:MAG: hypothetical protein AAGM40_12195 [Cyanobacteria bacterium J06573_2]